MGTELDELIDFLSSPSPQLKKAAVDIVRDLTGSEETIASFSTRADAAVSALTTLLRDNTTPQVSVVAAQALVNLSQNTSLSQKIVEHGTVKVAMDVLYGKSAAEAEIARLLIMLLVNVTQLDSGVNALLQIGDEKLEGLYISKLVRSFSRTSDDAISGVDPFEHVGSILVNISKIEAARKILLDSRRSLLKQIIPQFESPSLLRKKGVSGTVRNCCFEADNYIDNLLSVSEFLWPLLLLPVAGKKAYNEQDTSKMPPELKNPLSHEREPVKDPELRIQALDSIYLVILQEAGRKAFWCVNGPRILEVGYENEEDPGVMEAYERVGSLLVT